MLLNRFIRYLHHVNFIANQIKNDRLHLRQK